MVTEEQYKKYQKIEKETAPIKDFLEWSGKKYKNKMTSLYRFSIKTFGAKFGLYMHRLFCTIPENEFELPVELQDRIIEVLENYVDEKEQEKAEI